MPAAIPADRCPAATPGWRSLVSRTGKRTELARSFPAGHMVQMELHEFPGHRHRFFLVAELEDRITADDFLGFHEWAVDDTELVVLDTHLRTGLHRHQPAIVEHAAGLDLPIGELVHGVQQLGRWAHIRFWGRNNIHKAHPELLLERAAGIMPLNCLAHGTTNQSTTNRQAF